MRILHLPTVLVVLGTCGCTAPRTASPVPGSRLEVVDISVGRAIGADKRVTAPAETFGARDTIYASVVTKGEVKRATVSARWTHQGALLDETDQTIAPDGTAVSEFHIFNPAGWSPGQYRVEILIEGRVVGERAFKVDAS